MNRRHLSREQKRALIAESLRADPELPDYQHARRTGASPHTVKSVRESDPDLQNANDGIRVNARGQERPASYARPASQPPRPEPEPEPPAPSWEPAGHLPPAMHPRMAAKAIKRNP